MPKMIAEAHVKKVVIQKFADCFLMLVYHSEDIFSIYKFDLDSLVLETEDMVRKVVDKELQTST